MFQVVNEYIVVVCKIDASSMLVVVRDGWLDILNIINIIDINSIINIIDIIN